MNRACVIGCPVSHSRSPIIHNHWLRTHNIRGGYERVSVAPGNLKIFIETLDAQGYSGCNVTIPHKESVFSLVQIADEPTNRLGAVNTVYIRGGIVLGTNTDGEGFVANVRETVLEIHLKNERVAILGAGGSAMAIAGTLLDQGVAEITVISRSIDRGYALQRRFGEKIRPNAWDSRNHALAECQLLVNTTPLGMTGQPPLVIDLGFLPPTAVVADIVYTPLITAFLKQASERGHPTVGGLGMLLHQAVRGFELWFGIHPKVTKELYDLVARDIDPDYRR